MQVSKAVELVLGVNEDPKTQAHHLQVRLSCTAFVLDDVDASLHYSACSVLTTCTSYWMRARR